MSENEGKEHLGLVVVGHVDSGKSAKKGTNVIMYAGNLKKVEDIIVGDQLMGDNSRPKTVTKITNGKGQMYKIIPHKGDPFTVNDQHIMTFKVTNPTGVFYDDNQKRFKVRWMNPPPVSLQEKTFTIGTQKKEDVEKEAKDFLSEKIKKKETLVGGDVVDIPLTTYMTFKSDLKSYFKVYHVGVDFPTQPVDWDPYFLGVWLGNGTSKATEITNPDQEIIDYLELKCLELGLECNQKNTTDGIHYNISASGDDKGRVEKNLFMNFLRDSNLLDNKHIPEDYLVNDRKTRLAVLAGILDTDGYFDKGYYELTTKFERLAKDVKFLAHSLGMMVTITETWKKAQTMTEKKKYYRLNIMGDSLTDLPMLVPRKKCTSLNPNKDSLVYGFDVEDAGQGEYFGFEMEGNGRFLLEDFTVTHNSTTTGHLIYQLGGLKDRELIKLKEEAEQLGKGSFAYAFFTDRQKEERARGVTISCTTKEFFTKTKHFSLVDAPGHRDFVKNMISGTAQADVALLMVPAQGFEVAIAKGDRKTGKVEGQTRQHAMLTNLLGIEQLIVGINKMDAENVKWSETRFNEIKDEVTRMLKQVGWGKKLPEIPFIPMSGLQGDNLSHVSEHMPWYKGFEVEIDGKKITGHTLIDALEDVARVPPRRPDAPFRMPVSGVHNIKGVGDVITGRIEQGTLKKEDKIAFAPTGITGCKAFSIEMHHRRVDEASHGDNVGVNVKGLKKEFMPKVGDIMVLDDGKLPTAAKEFTALIAVQEHPGELKIGYTPIVFVRTARSACKMTKINWKVGKSTNKQKVENPHSLVQGDQAEVVFEPAQDIYIDKFSDCPGLGRVAIMEGNSLVMLGKVQNVVRKDKK